MKSFCHLVLLGIIMLALISCGTGKQVSDTIKVDVREEKSLEGRNVYVTEFEASGIDEAVKTLNDSGTGVEYMPFYWFAAMSTADDQQTAIEMAQREAYAVVSQVFDQHVITEASRGSLVNNGNTQKALKSHWEQVSSSVIRACRPYQKARIEYNRSTRKYTVTAKVGIRGDVFIQLMDQAAFAQPEGLSEEEMKQFIEINNSIINAAKAQ